MVASLRYLDTFVKMLTAIGCLRSVLLYVDWLEERTLS